jgi:ABC-type lipoprotein release transport system permease subunit
MITGFLGFVIGAGMTVIIAPFAQDTVPQFVVYVRWQDILAVASATILMSLLAAYIPVRRIASIDPVTVFKG